MSYCVKKVSIASISPDINNALIIAVIIAKQNLRAFTSKKDSEERGVWSFTLRDSPLETINCTIWGTSDFVRYHYETFNIGDVVEIISPRILFKQSGGGDTSFNPPVSSPFQLQLQENSSELLAYSGDDFYEIRDLIHIPTKSPENFLRLSDVFSRGQAMKGEYVNLLVAVQKIGEIKKVKSRKTYKEFMCRNVTVMDQTHLEFHITLWSEEIIKRSDNWRSRKTVIFFSDIMLEWDNYRCRITAKMTSRTVVTENPQTNEAIALENFVKTAPIHPTAVLDHCANSIVNANTVNTVMTTAQVLDKAYGRGSSGDQFTALIYAMVTKLNLDGSENVIAYNCPRCCQTLDETGSCLNSECLTDPTIDFNCAQISFNLRISLTDHRGTLHNCRLVSPTADEILGCSVNHYLEMSVQEKTKLKWNLLLTRCEARILVLCTSPERPRPLISLLSCTPAKSKDVTSKIPLY